MESGWNVWVWLLGVVVKRYIDFLILLIPTPLVSVLFYSSIPTFCSFFVVFVFLLNVFIRLHLLLNDLVFHCIHIKYKILKYILINN